jgi:hypothetical protein
MMLQRFVRLEESIICVFSTSLDIPIPRAGTNYSSIISELLQAGHGYSVHNPLRETRLRLRWAALFEYAGQNIAIDFNAIKDLIRIRLCRSDPAEILVKREEYDLRGLHERPGTPNGRGGLLSCGPRMPGRIMYTLRVPRLPV